MCNNFKRNRVTFISKSALVSQAEALYISTGALLAEKESNVRLISLQLSTSKKTVRWDHGILYF